MDVWIDRVRLGDANRSTMEYSQIVLFSDYLAVHITSKEYAALSISIVPQRTDRFGETFHEIL